MDTLTPLHDELDASLARILLDIEVKGRLAVWDLQEMYWEKDDWAFPSPLFVDPSPRSWQEQIKLWEKYHEGKALDYALPGSLHHGGKAFDYALFDEIAPRRLSDLLSGHAFDRVLGNEPWHFEFTPPRLPWWKRNALYRAVKRYRFARSYGASKRKALGVKIWPRRNGKSVR